MDAKGQESAEPDPDVTIKKEDEEGHRSYLRNGWTWDASDGVVKTCVWNGGMVAWACEASPKFRWRRGP